VKGKTAIRLRSLLLAGSLFIAMLVIAGCGRVPPPVVPGETPPPAQETPGGGQTPGQETKVITKEESQAIALNFLLGSATYRFDGIPNSLVLARSEGDATSGRWVFDYKFQNRQAGYGDRTGMILAQVITDHQAEIIVKLGVVQSAILDGQWDELRQKPLR